MAERNSNKCMFIGLPGSGKSSFIGAFWHVASTGEINSAYAVSVQPRDRDYLNKLQAKFLECRAPERTKIEVNKKIELQIKNNTSGKVVDFIFPDLSGETFLTQFEHRKLTKAYADEIQDGSSIIIFINPDLLKRPVLISQAMPMFADITSTNSNSSSEDVVKWKARECQTQVILVDLLQIIVNRIKKPCKIGVIVSAWDLIKNMADEEKASVTPLEWLKEYMPLFYQFLLSNKELFVFDVFGISAQGGQYDEKDNKALKKFVKQSERIIVQSDAQISSDITVPIQWLFEN